MNEELIALYQNIEKHYPGSLGTLEEFNSWAGANRGTLKSFLDSAEADFPKAFEAYVPPSMEFESIQMDAAVDPFGWMGTPGNVLGLPPVPRKPVKRTKEDILGNIFPIPMEDVKSEQRRLADNEMMRIANEKTEGQKLSALIGTRDVFPWETDDVLEEARTSDPKRLVSPWQKDNIEDEAGMTALSTVIDPTEYTPEEIARIYKPEEYQNRKREIDIIRRSEDEIGTPKKINERSTMPISMTGYNTREVRLNTSHDDAVRNIEYLTKAGIMSTSDILEADEINGYSDEELLRMKDALTLDDRLRSEHEMHSLSLYGNVLTKRVNSIPQETRDQIEEAWGILDAANTEAESGALSEEALQAAREAESFLRANQEAVDSYAKLTEQLGSLQSRYEQVGNKYPDLKLADELNKRIQGQVDQWDKARRSNKLLQGAGKLLWGPLAPIGPAVTRPVLEFVPKLLGRVSSTIDGELAANGDVSAEIRMLRRSRDRVQSGTFRDPSRVAGGWSRNLTEFEFEGEKYDMVFDGDTPIEIYDKDGYAADLPSNIKDSLMTEGAVLGLHSMAKRQWSSDRMVNMIQDVGSDLLGTFALAFATRGLGSGVAASRLREVGSIMLQYEGSFVEEGLREGLPIDQAINYGRLKALIEGGWEAAFPFISKVTDGRVVGETKDALKRILADGDPQKLKAFATAQIRKNLMGVPQEGLEEVGVAVTDPFANQILNNAYNVDLDTEFPDLIELGETFALGAAVSIIPASIGAANTRRRVKGVESLREAVVTAVRDLDGVKAAAAQFNDPKLNEMVPIFEAVANKSRAYLRNPNFTDTQITTYIGALFDAEMAMQDRVENTGTRLEEELIERQRQADEEVRRAIDELPLIPTTDDSQDTEGVSGEVEGGQETGGTVQDETGGGEAVETGGVLQTPEEVTPLGEISDEEFKTFEDIGEVSQERKQDIARKIATPGVILSDIEEVVRQAFSEEIQAMVDDATPPEVVAQEVVDALPQEVKTSTTATGVQSLGKILTDVFGLKAGKVQGTAKLMDTMIGKMAQRAGVSKKTMYSRLEFQKVTEEQLDQIRAEGGESVLSRQRTGKRQQAAVRLLQDGRATIYAISDPNISSPLHELSHVFERFLTKAEIQTILSSAGVDVNTLDEEGLRNAWTTDISEFFARGFERYLYEGASLNENIRAVFDKFRTWLLEIYNDFLASDIDVPINDAMRGIYANMLGQDVVILNPSTPRGSQTALEDNLLNEIFGRTLFQTIGVRGATALAEIGNKEARETYKEASERVLVLVNSFGYPADSIEDITESVQALYTEGAFVSSMRGIKKDTGWEMDRSGRMVYEVGPIKITSAGTSLLLTRGVATLRQILPKDHPLLGAYPELVRKTLVQLGTESDLGEGVLGALNLTQKRPVIRLLTTLLDMPEPRSSAQVIEIEGVSYYQDENSLATVLEHEVQHLIQAAEGHILGSSPEAHVQNLALEYLGFSSIEDYQRDLDDLEGLLSEVKNEEDLQILMSRIGKVLGGLNDALEREEILEGAMDRYNRTYGEISARSNARRWGMSPDERRNSLIYDTEDYIGEEILNNLQAAKKMLNTLRKSSPLSGLVQIYEDFRKVLPRNLYAFDASKHPELLEAVNRFRETEAAKTLPTNLQAGLYGYSQEQDNANVYDLVRGIEIHIAEADLLEHERKNRPVYLAMIDEIINETSDERLRVNRLPQGIEQEGRRGKLAQISSVLHARERANREKFSPQRFLEDGEFIFFGGVRRRFQILSREIEEGLIRTWAEKQGIWYTEETFADLFGDLVIASGAESLVYLSPDGFNVVKKHSAPAIQTFDATEDNRTPNGWMRLLDRLTIGNAFMPGDAQELVGFVFSDEETRAILVQPFVEYEVPNEQPDDVVYDTIVENMTNLGFIEVSKFQFIRGPILVKDGHANNFVVDANGNFRILDGIWSLDTPSEGYGGTEQIGYEPSELEMDVRTRLQPIVTKQSVIDAVRVLAASTEAPVDSAAAYRSGRATYEAVGLSQEEFAEVLSETQPEARRIGSTEKSNGTFDPQNPSILFQAPTETNLPAKEVALQRVRDLRDRGETAKVSLDNLYEKGKPYLDKIGITREEFMEAAAPVSGWQQTVNQFTPDTGGVPGGPVAPPIAVTPATMVQEEPVTVEQTLESRSIDKIMEWGVFQAADEFVTPESYETLVRIGKLEDTPENRAAYLTTRMKIEASQATMNSLLYDILSDFTTEGRTRNDFDIFILGILNDNRINDDAKTAILNTAYSWELSPNQRRLLDNKWVELGQRASRALNLRRVLSRDPFLSNEDMGLIRDAMLSSGGPNAADMRGVLNTLESLEEDSTFEDADLVDLETEEQTQARIRALEAELDATESEEFTKPDEGLAGASDLAAAAMSNLLGPETQQESEALGKKKGMARKKTRIVNTVRDQVNEARKLC